MIATCLFPEHDYWMGDARIYRLSRPYRGFSFIAITVTPVAYGQWQNAGVEVVGCDVNGRIPGDSVTAIYQSYLVMTHDEVLAELGYTEVQ